MELILFAIIFFILLSSNLVQSKNNLKVNKVVIVDSQTTSYYKI